MQTEDGDSSDGELIMLEILDSSKKNYTERASGWGQWFANKSTGVSISPFSN